MAPAVLLVENNSDDAFLFERALQKVQPDALLVVMSSVAEAQQYLAGEGIYADRKAHPFPNYIVTNNALALKQDNFLKWLQEHPRYGIVPTLVLSGSEDPTDTRASYRLGAHTYFRKTAKLQDWQDMLRLIFDYWQRATIPRSAERACDKS